VAARRHALDLRGELLRIVRDEARVSVGETVLEHHSRDFSYHEPHAPDVVVYPESTEEVSAVLAFADREGVPVVPFGVGTSLEGHVIPVHGGISLDLTRMDRILAIHAGDLAARVQPGVLRSRLNERAAEHGLFFPVDPGADATLGGMAATNASGTTTVRYGNMRAQVLALEVVLADGRVVRTGGRAAKSSAGYALTHLFVGSEGTLGVLTELTLRLYGIPEHVVAARASFPDVESACRTAAALVGFGLSVTRCELMDAPTIHAVNRHKGTDYPEEPTLVLELGGSEPSVESDLEAAQEIASSEGCTAFVFERDADARRRLWDARHQAALALLAEGAGRSLLTTDVCVPISELPQAIAFGRATMERLGLEASMVGHVGDGNYHAAILVDPADGEHVARAQEANAALVRDALARGGTCTGEHGVGLGKIPYLEAEHADLLPLMRGIKDLLDPNGILNPGKVLPGLGQLNRRT
jgi:D-lactate dehydrogenase (cytochrome)